MTFKQILEIVDQLSTDYRIKLSEHLQKNKKLNYEQALAKRKEAGLARLAKDKIRYRPRTEWIRGNAKDYQDQWLAFEENILFASGKDREKVCEEARTKGASMISLFRIGKDGKSSFGSW